jgi:hypothetical protein
LATGVPGLDEVLGGGLPEFSFNLIAGPPGCGKTTPAPMESDATLAMTSFTFMLLCVPEPVCQTDKGNWASNSPAATRAAAAATACAFAGSSKPRSPLTSAAARLISANA